MARIDIDQATILRLITEHLQRELTLGPRQCYEVLDPRSPNLPKGGGWFLTVAPGGGDFPQQEQIPEQCTELWQVTVTIYSRLYLDSTDHDQKRLRDSTRGLLVLKQRVLEALVGQDLRTDEEPTDAESDTFLRNLVYPLRASRAQVDEQHRIGWLSIDFGVDFDWDLT